MADKTRPKICSILLTSAGAWCGFMLYWLCTCMFQITENGIAGMSAAMGVPWFLAAYIEFSFYVIGFLFWMFFGMGLCRIILWAYAWLRGEKVVTAKYSVKKNPLWILCLVQAVCAVVFVLQGTAASSGGMFALISRDQTGIMAVMGMLLGFVSAVFGVILFFIVFVLELLCILAVWLMIRWYYEIRDGKFVILANVEKICDRSHGES